MKITKLGHCCLLIEHKNKRILTDPGAYTTAQTELRNIDLILISHEHSDHLHVESLATVLQNSPEAKIITNTSVGKILAEKGITFNVLEDGGSTSFDAILLEAFGTIHDEIYEELGRVQNTGYFIDDKLFYPGDAFTNPGKSVDVLALPVAGPWTSIKMAMQYALEIKPRIAFPVHDGMLMAGRAGTINFISPQALEPKGIKFVPLSEGESFETE